MSGWGALPSRGRRLLARGQVLDALLTAALLAGSLPSLWLRPTYLAVPIRPADVWGVLLVTAATLPVGWRRRAPLAAFALGVPPALVLGLSSYNQGLAGVPLLVLLYSVAAHRARWQGLCALVGCWATTLLVELLGPLDLSLADAIGALAVYLTGWALGRSLRMRRAYVAELEARAAVVQAEQAAETRAALAEERGRIARELHDVVAHHVSVMTVQAAAARRTLRRDTERAEEALAAVEHTGRAALSEMRRLVGVLRDAEPTPDGAGGGSPGGRVPAPTLVDLCSLVEQVREAGLPVELSVRGRRPVLDPGRELTLYRIVQESLTNVLKHAGPARAQVELDFARGRVAVRVQDDGRGAAAGLTRVPGARSGHGVVGMRERVALYGGWLEAGPVPGGGYRVLATVPLEIPAASAPSDTPPVPAARARPETAATREVPA
ncbi:MAG TPA: sensor histidine kinase [Motilibacteraceae bacterium]|nr:sensor histidine kinase [Motilibacteraceae bacterium]